MEKMTGEKQAEKKPEASTASLEGSITIKLDSKGVITCILSEPDKKYTLNQMLGICNNARAYILNVKM